MSFKKLTITVHEAKGLKDGTLLTKMTTYVTFKCGTEEFKTKPCEKGGVNPKFDNQSFIFNLDKNSDVVHVTLFSKETVSDDKIGRMDLKVTALAKAEKPTWFDISDVSNFNQIRGQISLSCQTDAPKVEQKQVTAPEKAAPAPVQQQVVQPQVVHQQPQVVHQQQPMMQPAMMQQPMMAAAPMMMPQVVMMGQPQPMMQPMVMQPQMMYGQQPMMQMQPQPMMYGQPAPMGQFGQPVRLQYPNQQQYPYQR